MAQNLDIINSKKLWISIGVATAGAGFIYYLFRNKTTSWSIIGKHIQKYKPLQELLNEKLNNFQSELDETGRAYNKETCLHIDELVILSAFQEFPQTLKQLRQLRRTRINNKQVYLEQCFSTFMVLSQAFGRNKLDSVLGRVKCELPKYQEGILKVDDEEITARRLGALEQVNSNLKGKILDHAKFENAIKYRIECFQQFIEKASTYTYEDLIMQPNIIEDYTAIKFQVESEDLEETIRDMFNKNDKTFQDEIATLIKLGSKVEIVLEDQQEELLKKQPQDQFAM